ncbi:hypothetical protein [Nocardioides sediminis]|uniref:hypothetical protein n=1 Tax=Nocardioides sediminis TaxID=433648 RepID=UPI000D3062C7|nr:hypothetical protein [Nocardioides sediminis]
MSRPTAASDDVARPRVSARGGNLVAAVSFVIGGSLFAVGAVLAQLDVTSLVAVNVTYLVGGFFFSLGGYVSILLARPLRLEWRSAVILFVGTLLFAVSLVAAFAAGLTPRQSNGWIWLPDISGCICFLVSGHLAMVAVGGGRVRVRPDVVGWWVVAVNQLGSVLFFLAGLAAFTRPTTSQAVDAGLVNWGTFTGAVCFAAGGLIQAFDTPATTPENGGPST